jgi:hypothetical protein
MTAAEIADCDTVIGHDADRCGVPLLHLRGTEYGLRIHGLRRELDDAAHDNLKECHDG